MQRNKRERKAPPTFEAGQGGGLATSSKATGSKANEGANDGSDDDSNWVPTKKVKQAAKKKVASKTASTQEEKAGLRRIRERRNEHVNLLAKQLQEEANNEDADDHAAGNASSLKDANTSGFHISHNALKSVTFWRISLCGILHIIMYG